MFDHSLQVNMLIYIYQVLHVVLKLLCWIQEMAIQVLLRLGSMLQPIGSYIPQMASISSPTKNQ